MFYRQARVGRFGVPFEFLKLRSMVVGGDECIHSDYVREFMHGTAEAVATGVGDEAIFKRVDDPGSRASDGSYASTLSMRRPSSGTCSAAT